MMWLWLSLSWLFLAGVAGLWLGAVMTVSPACGLADEVEAWLRGETAQRQLG